MRLLKALVRQSLSMELLR